MALPSVGPNGVFYNNGRKLGGSIILYQPNWLLLDCSYSNLHYQAVCPIGFTTIIQ